MSKRGNVELHYSGVNYDIVWDIATEELPKVLQQIEAILKDIET